MLITQRWIRDATGGSSRVWRYHVLIDDRPLSAAITVPPAHVKQIEEAIPLLLLLDPTAVCDLGHRWYALDGRGVVVVYVKD